MKNTFFFSIGFALLLFTGKKAHAQTPNIGFALADNTNNNNEWVQHLDASVSGSSFQIGMYDTNQGNLPPVPPPPNSYHWSVCVAVGTAPCGGSLTDVPMTTPTTPMGSALTFTLSSNTNAGVLTVATTGTYTTDQVFSIKVNIRDRDDPATIAKTRDYKVYIRRPIDMVFVLDRSGSMECPEGANTALDWPACIQSDITLTRWHKLEEGLQRFLINALPAAPGGFSSKTLTNDKYKLQYFSGTSVASDITITSIEKMRTDLHGDMTTSPRLLDPPIDNPAHRLAIDGTSLGLGLKTALNYFGAANSSRRRILLFFTDGEQNNTTNGYWSNGRSLENPRGTFSSTLPPQSNIEIYTVGIGLYASPAAQTTLEAIVEGGAGSHRFFVPNAGNDLMNTDAIPQNALAVIFNNYSPQLVRFEEQALDKSNSASFPLDAGLSDAFFEAVFEKPISGNGQTQFPNFRFQIFRNGRDMTGYATLNKGNYYATLHINFQKADTALYSRGEWLLKVNSA